MVSRYEFKDVWHALKHDKNFDYVFWIDILLQILAFRSVRLLGYAMVAVAYVLITIFCVTGMLVVIPEVSAPNSIWRYFNYLFGMVYYTSLIII